MRIIEHVISLGVALFTAVLLIVLRLLLSVPPMFLIIVLVLYFFVLVLLRMVLKRVGIKREGLDLVGYVSAVAILSLYSLVEWKILQFFLIFLGSAIMGYLYHPGIVLDEEQYKQKIHRRILSMIWVFNVYSFLTNFFAFTLFQFILPFWPLSILVGFFTWVFTLIKGLFISPHIWYPEGFDSAFSYLNYLFVQPLDIPFWLIATLAGLAVSYISILVWRMYVSFPFKKSPLWIVILTLIIFELMWVVNILPFGYLVSGFILTWIWYVVQLLLRFHFSAQGIIWGKQKWFLIFNLFFFIITLVFFIRWV